MSHDIETNYVEDYGDMEKRCCLCESFTDQGENGYCRELEQIIPSNAHCDFFQSKE